jgi:hypothetical protein
MDSAYGFPCFAVLFSSPEELAAAEASGLNDTLSHAIGTLCQGLGSKRNPFDPDRAIHFTYVGWLEEATDRALQSIKSAR